MVRNSDNKVSHLAGVVIKILFVDSNSSATSFTITSFALSDLDLVVTGTGFTYDSSFCYELTGGIFTGFKFLTPTGSSAFELSGFSLTAAQLNSYSTT